MLAAYQVTASRPSPTSASTLLRDSSPAPAAGGARPCGWGGRGAQPGTGGTQGEDEEAAQTQITRLKVVSLFLNLIAWTGNVVLLLLQTPALVGGSRNRHAPSPTCCVRRHLAHDSAVSSRGRTAAAAWSWPCYYGYRWGWQHMPQVRGHAWLAVLLTQGPADNRRSRLPPGCWSAAAMLQPCWQHGGGPGGVDWAGDRSCCWPVLAVWWLVCCQPNTALLAAITGVPRPTLLMIVLSATCNEALLRGNGILLCV